MPLTEDRDPKFTDIDQWPTEKAVAAMLDGQIDALKAARESAGSIARAAEAAATRLLQGGRLIYSGAGTSGRVSVQDGVELGPTFGWPDDRLAYLLAGGMDALSQSAEGAEDDAVAGIADVEAASIGPSDVVIGVAASGRTPYTIAVLDASRTAGALTIGISNNPDAPILSDAEYAIVVPTGSEIIAGSTRMKAGTAQKAVLNAISTAIMLRLGRVHDGLMVDMVVSNEKLRKRAEAIVASIAGCSAQDSATALDQTSNHIKAAILVARGYSANQAFELLKKVRGHLRLALEGEGE